MHDRVKAIAPTAITLTLLLGFGLWLFSPGLSMGEEALLASNPDGYSAAWVLDTFASGRTIGPLSWQIGSPEGFGALYVPMGFLGAAALSPLTALLGPVQGYNLAVVLLLVLGSLSLVWLGRELEVEWPGACLAGLLLLAQPVTLQLARDGDIEHMSFWALFGGLAALLRGLRTRNHAFAALGSVLLSILPVEHTYGVVYAVLLVPLVAIPELRRQLKRDAPQKRETLRMLAVALLAALPGLLLCAALFGTSNLNILQGRAQDVAAHNSVDLASWLDFLKRGAWAVDNPQSCAPFLDTATLCGALLLGLLGLPRSLPLLLCGLLFLAFSLGPGETNPAFLESHLGLPGRILGAAIQGMNESTGGFFPFSFVRFPRRWALVGGALLLLAAGRGLGRLGPLLRSLRAPGWLSPAILLPLGLGTSITLAHLYNARLGVPALPAPTLEACAWLADQPGSGGVMLLPTIRIRKPGGDETFASVAPGLSAFDRMWIQVRHGRPQNQRLDTIPTIRPFHHAPGGASRWVATADRIADQKMHDLPLSEQEISRWRDSAEVNEARDELRAAGWRWILVESQSYQDEARDQLELLLGSSSATRREFNDGTGLLIYEL